MKNAKKLLAFKKYKKKKKYVKPVNHEDELLRSEKKERGHKLNGSSVQEIHNEVEDDTIHGDVERIGGSDIEHNIDSPDVETKIVGMVDPNSLGPIAQRILGKKMREIAAIMQNGGSMNKGYWVSYLEARRSGESQTKNVGQNI